MSCLIADDRTELQPSRVRSLAAKRAMDLALALPAIAALAPLMILVGAAVLVGLGRPVLFRQVRAGRHGRTFTILKFRTMIDGPGDDQARLTRLGRLLRRTSLDELPQLWNVVRGEMSLVGPRPLLVDYLPLYTPEQARRHELPPGMTGWSQVRGRNASSWRERLADDVWYVDHRGLALDLRIMLLTVGKVLDGRGVTDGGATKGRFCGTEGGDA